jgi:hypothetical protein
MGLQIFQKLPSGEGELIAVRNLPISVEPNEAFHEAKRALEALVEDSRGIVNSITTEDEYNAGMAILGKINGFLKQIEAGAKPSKDSLNQAKDELMRYIHELDAPAKRLKDMLGQETGRYKLEADRKRREEEERLRREAELDRQRKQREADLNALRLEIQTAEQEARAAEMRDQPDTAKGIRAATKRFVALDSAPGAFQDPLGDATRLRSAVALAQQHEQARIAAAKAKAEGDKKTAKKIEQAAAKLEAPTVEAVRSEQVKTAPVVIPKPELAKAKGAFVKDEWRVKEIYNPSSVPREFCVPSESLLNDYAKRVGSAASVPGVTFERHIKTAGVRS